MGNIETRVERSSIKVKQLSGPKINAKELALHFMSWASEKLKQARNLDLRSCYDGNKYGGLMLLYDKKRPGELPFRLGDVITLGVLCIRTNEYDTLVSGLPFEDYKPSVGQIKRLASVEARIRGPEPSQ